MNEIFVDTLHLIARFNPRDQWHQVAVEAEAVLLLTPLVITESVLIETLNFFGGFRPEVKEYVAGNILDFFTTQSIKILPHSSDVFLEGLRFYRSRLDKGYSLTDCISMNVCRERGIREVLTHDHHFEQEGFTILL